MTVVYMFISMFIENYVCFMSFNFSFVAACLRFNICLQRVMTDSFSETEMDVTRTDYSKHFSVVASDTVIRDHQNLLIEFWHFVESRKSPIISTLPQYARKSLIPPSIYSLGFKRAKVTITTEENVRVPNNNTPIEIVRDYEDIGEYNNNNNYNIEESKKALFMTPNSVPPHSSTVIDVSEITSEKLDFGCQFNFDAVISETTAVKHTDPVHFNDSGLGTTVDNFLYNIDSEDEAKLYFRTTDYLLKQENDTYECIELGNKQPSLETDGYIELRNKQPSLDTDGFMELGNKQPSLETDEYIELGNKQPSLEADGFKKLRNKQLSLDTDGFIELGNKQPSLDTNRFIELGNKQPSVDTDGFIELGIKQPSLDTFEYIELGNKRLSLSDKSDSDEDQRRLSSIAYKKRTEPQLPDFDDNDLENIRRINEADDEVSFGHTRNIFDTGVNELSPLSLSLLSDRHHGDSFDSIRNGRTSISTYENLVSIRNFSKPLFMHLPTSSPTEASMLGYT